MSRKHLDRRVQKTLQLLEGALRELITEKEYDDITVQEILDRANVGRSTFYTHFENKDQLLRSLLTHLNERFDKGIRQLWQDDRTLADDAAHTPLRVLRFVEEHHGLFKAMLVPNGGAAGRNPFSDYLFLLTREHLKQMMAHAYGDGLEMEMAAHFYTNAFIGAITWWLENGRPCSAERLAELVTELTLVGLEGEIEGRLKREEGSTKFG